MKTLLLQGDCFEQLDKIEDESVGSVVADPPYLIDFMGKGWDSPDNIAGNPNLYKKLLTKMKPGGYVALFGHSRTHHRIMVALEEAGFELKDTLTWLYGQGFPKSHNISKSLDKQGKDGAKWEGYGTALKPAVEFIVLAQKPRKGTYANNCLTYGVGGLNIDECRIGTSDTLSRPHNEHKPEHLRTMGKFAKFGNPNSISDKLGRFPANLILSHSDGCVKVGESVESTSNHNAPKGTFAGGEPDRGSETIYRKQENTVEHYECDDECAVRLLNEQSGTKKGSGKQSKGSGSGGIWKPSTGKPAGDTYGDSGGAGRFFKTTEAPEGRFPANLILSHSEGCVKVGEGKEDVIGGNKGKSGFAVGYESGDFTKQQKSYDVYDCDEDCAIRMLDEQAPKVGNAFKAKRKKDTTGGSGDSWTNGGKKEGEGNGTYDGLSGASRFFYCAKVSKKERNFGVGHREKCSAEKRDATGAGLWETKGFNKPQHNHHPTLKPVALMRWLVRLITPPEETCLDLFMGAGSTGGACVLEDRDFIGIELDNDYFSIACDRIDAWKDSVK